MDWKNTSTKQTEIPFMPARVLCQVDVARSDDALQANMECSGIVHQVNLEYLLLVVFEADGSRQQCLARLSIYNKGGLFLDINQDKSSML
ncbi:uncharacterized protein LOC110273642 [Arachis duranensis]|uniref:Uncharacterized protein LOC110273642 n=1 Tax=Arachis duranensis TaxID=130453 RepID=A0A9C6TFA6_ARADU|nr:uncharacterized protein LOC110273642 [Arachis duranensis]